MYFFNKAFAAETALALVSTAPRLLAANRFFWTIESRSPNSNGRPGLLLNYGNAFFGDLPFAFAVFRSASTLFRNVRAVLSLMVGKRCLKFLTVAAGP